VTVQEAASKILTVEEFVQALQSLISAVSVMVITVPALAA
jgi:hypothetical protein